MGTTRKTRSGGACDLWERVRAAFANGLAVVAEGIDLVRGLLVALFNEACNIFTTGERRFAGAAAKAKETATDTMAKAKKTAIDMRNSTERFASSAQSKTSELRARASRCTTSAKNNIQKKCSTKSQGYNMTSLPRLLGTAWVSDKKQLQD